MNDNLHNENLFIRVNDIILYYSTQIFNSLLPIRFDKHDIRQELWLRTLESEGKYDDKKAKPLTFYKRVIANRSIDIYRKFSETHKAGVELIGVL